MINFNNTILNEKEIKEVLIQFKKYLKDTNNNNIIINNNNIDPFAQNCYISTGAIAGVYFPNNEIKIKNDPFYDFLCVGKNARGEFGYYERLKPDAPFHNLNEFYFTPFVKINEEFFAIKFKMQEELNKLEKNYKILKSCKIVTKKDGKPFKEFEKNFIYKYKNEVENPEIKQHYNCYNYLSSFEICFYYDFNIYNYIDSNNQKALSIADLYTPQSFYNDIILNELKKLDAEIKKTKNNLKTLLKDFLKVEKLKKDYESKKNKITNKNYFLRDFMCVKY